MEQQPIRRHVVVHGSVQGVFFRDSCRREATYSGVAGWVRNRSDGTVEAVFEGSRKGVERLLAWVEQGPPHAQVQRVDVDEQPPAGESGFRVI